MKKILCLLILTLIIATGCVKKQPASTLNKIIKNDTIKVGVKTDAKPFGFISESTGKNEGFDVDIARYIARDILGSDKNIEFISVNPNTRIEAVTSEKVDMVIATMSITPQRQYFVDFSIPYYVAGQTALVKKNSNIKTFYDLKNKISIVVLGTNAEQNLRRIVPTAKVIGYKTYEDAFKALKENRGQALITDDSILSDYVFQNPDYIILKNKISIEPYAIALKKENNQEFKKYIDNVISRMNKDGTIKYLKKKWHLM